MSPSTLYEWKRRFPEISEALKKGKEVVDIEVENALLRRATGYDAVETIEEVSDKNGRSVKRVTRHVPGDVTAQIFWLKNRRPDKWKDKQDVQVSGELKEEQTKLDDLIKQISGDG